MSSTYLNRSKTRYRRAAKVVWYKDFALMIKILPAVFLLVVSVVALLAMSAGATGKPEPKKPKNAVTDADGAVTDSSDAPSQTTAQGEVTITANDRFGWNLILVNTEYPLPDDYQPPELVNFGPGKAQCDARIKDELERMLSDAAAAGCPVAVLSDYRTIEKQRQLYENKVDEVMRENPDMGRVEAEAEAAKIVTYPGTGEHHTGLAFDIASEGDYDLTERFAKSPAYKWLKEHCADYGFIIRYPEDKTYLTGITYEPWHYRYVGKKHAKEIERLNMCLEEYIEYLASLESGGASQ